MTDKDQFTFDDDTDYLETDLSDAFSEGDFEADSPAPDPGDSPDPEQDDHVDRTDRSSGSGGSRTRMLLLVLLLVVAGAAGVSYFMGLGEVTPTVPTAPPAVKNTQKTVALPPQPTAAPTEETTQSKKAPEQTAAVAVSPPPPPARSAAQPVAEDTTKPALAEPVEGADKPQPAPSGPSAGEQPVQTAEPVAVPAPPVPSRVAADDTTQTKPSPSTDPAALPQQAPEGLFALDAGSYLFDSNRDALVAKIEKLGYEPWITPVEAKLNMTRLRVGTYRKEEVKNALDFARSIEPGAYSAPAGDGYVIYAGTFLKKETVEKLTRRFHTEGLKVYAEPIEVVRTLSRIRFGRFATRSDAGKAAEIAGQAGVRADIVKAR